jgi:hypothetical protein
VSRLQAVTVERDDWGKMPFSVSDCCFNEIEGSVKNVRVLQILICLMMMACAILSADPWSVLSDAKIIPDEEKFGFVIAFDSVLAYDGIGAQGSNAQSVEYQELAASLQTKLSGDVPDIATDRSFVFSKVRGSSCVDTVGRGTRRDRPPAPNPSCLVPGLRYQWILYKAWAHPSSVYVPGYYNGAGLANPNSSQFATKRIDLAHGLWDDSLKVYLSFDITNRRTLFASDPAAALLSDAVAMNPIPVGRFNPTGLYIYLLDVLRIPASRWTEIDHLSVGWQSDRLGVFMNLDREVKKSSLGEVRRYWGNGLEVRYLVHGWRFSQSRFLTTYAAMSAGWWRHPDANDVHALRIEPAVQAEFAERWFGLRATIPWFQKWGSAPVRTGFRPALGAFLHF